VVVTLSVLITFSISTALHHIPILASDADDDADLIDFLNYYTLS